MAAAEHGAAPSRHFVIVGAMGSGKTTLARGVAKELHLAFYDSDVWIMERTGRKGREIAESDGVDALHRLEREALWEALAAPEPSVIAAAASVIDDPGVRKALDGVFCVWVNASPEILARRSARGTHRRQVGPEEVERLARRTEYFRGCADLIVDTGELSEQEAVFRVLAELDVT